MVFEGILNGAMRKLNDTTNYVKDLAVSRGLAINNPNHRGGYASTSKSDIGRIRNAIQQFKDTERWVIGVAGETWWSQHINENASDRLFSLKRAEDLILEIEAMEKAESIRG